MFCSLGLFGGGGHYLVIRAFQLGPAAVIATLGYVELIGYSNGQFTPGAFDDVQTTPPRSPQKALIAAVEFM